MNRWEERRLGDLIEINPETMSVSKYKGYINYIDIGAVNKGNLEGYVSYDITEAPSRARRIVRDDDIIFSSVRPNLRAYYYMKDSPQNAVCSTGFTVLRASIGLIDSKFLYYLVTENSFVDYLSLVAKGSAYPAVDTTDFKKAKVTVPLLSVQKRIGDILSKYDDLIENNNKRIKILEQMAENLYKEWFVRFRFPGYEDAEFENGLPKGWEYVKLGEYTDISTGKCNREDAEDNGIYPLFDRSQEIKKSSVWLKDCEAIIVPGEGTSFIPRYFQGKFNLHQRCYCVEPMLNKTGKFIFYTLMLNRLYFLNVATGATVPSLRQKNFTNMKILMPEIGRVNKFDDIVSTFFDEINLLNEANQNLIKQRDRLLLRLMSGKLEV